MKCTGPGTNLVLIWQHRETPGMTLLKPPLQCWVLLFFTLVLFLGIFFLLSGKLLLQLQVYRPKSAIYMETLRFGIQ